MEIQVHVVIEKPRNLVWSTVTDIDNCADFISSIIDLEILNRPAQGLIGLKWKETRVMFGKEASETMWITEAIENEYYCTRAESHGSVYHTRIDLREVNPNCTSVAMSFTAEPQSYFVKILSLCMAPFMKKSIIKALHKDLEEIKQHLEQPG